MVSDKEYYYLDILHKCAKAVLYEPTTGMINHNQEFKVSSYSHRLRYAHSAHFVISITSELNILVCEIGALVNTLMNIHAT
jgi:hypothetical protein